jgi:hypothetical protein
MKYYLFSILLGCLLVGGCAKPPTVATTTTSPDFRWMDRNIYFAASGGTLDRNNEFQKQKVRDALVDIQNSTTLGPNYFSFAELDESLLIPTVVQTTSAADFKSFILIWPDAVFSDFVVSQLGGQVPDPNAIVVLNSAFKRKFYMIFRAGCFSDSTLNPTCGAITSTLGIRAMVARQIGLMTGLAVKSCADFPSDVMCASSPSDSQWLTPSKSQWIGSEDNVLESILRTPNFYQEFVPNPTSGP